MYAKLVDGKIIYAPEDFQQPDGSIIKNFTKYPELMLKYGFKKLEDNPPSFDETDSYLIVDSYIVFEDRIVVNYTVKPLEGALEKPTIEEQIAELQEQNNQLMEANEFLSNCILEMSEVIYA